MEYTCKRDRINKNRLKNLSDKLHKDPAAGLNTRAAAGSGAITNSHKNRIGRIINKESAADKSQRIIQSIHEKKPIKSSISEESINEEVAEFFMHKKMLKVRYNGMEMYFTDFIKKSEYDTGIKLVVDSLTAKKIKERFSGSLIDFVKQNFGGNTEMLDIVYRTKKATFNKD